MTYGLSPLAYEPCPDSGPIGDYDTAEYPILPDEVIPLPPCAICGADVCEHDRAARED